jgi:hypothetical protein
LKFPNQKCNDPKWGKREFNFKKPTFFKKKNLKTIQFEKKKFSIFLKTP